MNFDYEQQTRQLKDSLRIEDVIGAYVHLEHKAGGKYLGLCPFHDDSTPSMHVNVKDQYFKCFACNEGGDVFSFIQKMEHCSFLEAVKILRERWAGGSVPLIMHAPRMVPPKPAPEEASPALLAAMEAANHNFLKSLYGFHPELASEGDPAFNTASAIQKPETLLNEADYDTPDKAAPSNTDFTGMEPHHDSDTPDKTAPSNIDFTGMEPCTGQQSKSSQTALGSDFAGVKPVVPTGKYHPDCRGITQTYVDFEVGMAGRSVPKGLERFAGRIIFPIRDENGRLVGFSGRVTFEPTPEQKKTIRKYMNSSTNELFKKSNLLYGLHLAGNAIRNEGVCFLVEGYKDVLAMVAAGFPNTVAQCGSAFTHEQATLLGKYTKRVAVLMDADERGRDIAATTIVMLQKNGIQTSDLVLPKGDDPDSLFRRLGKQAFRTIVRESQLSDQIQISRAKVKQAHAENGTFLQGDTSQTEAMQASSQVSGNGYASEIQGSAGNYTSPDGNEETNAHIFAGNGTFPQADTSQTEAMQASSQVSGNGHASRIQGSAGNYTSPDGNEEIQLGSDRPRLKVLEQELQQQIRSLNSKRFLTGTGPDRILINTELMKLRSRLGEVSKHLNRPVVWY